MTEARIRVDFIADLSCPWCYVAWRALDRAATAMPAVAVDRVWAPFLLRPDTPPFGIDRRQYLAKIFEGAPERARASRDALVRAADDAGADLDLDAALVLPATLDAHRLIHWAGGQGRMSAAVDALFVAYHVQGRNIGDHDELREIAMGIGLDPGVVGDLLRTEADWNLIADAHNGAVEAGIRGVPVTLFNGRFARQGAETVATYARLLDAALGD
ncbi:MAG: DsbA family oxidoreductase [Hyphomonadaceae bacterium]|nr:DsbA family oxidoreductase [Hyphomonadaceae bacterium]